MPRRLLMIDDDEKLSALLKRYFSGLGIDLETHASGAAGIKSIKENPPELVILDVMLPEKSGYELCREIRQFSPAPIIMLTARGDITDRVVGLELGADDYVLKPVDPRELAARVDTVLRRSRFKPAETALFNYDGLKVETDIRRVTLDGNEVRLSTMEFEVLELFIKNPARVISRDQLLDNLRGIEWESANRSVDVLIARIRSKLGDSPKNPRFFKTIWGKGYLFIGSVQQEKKAS